MLILTVTATAVDGGAWSRGRGEVFAIRDGVETLCAVASQTVMILAGRADRADG